MSVLSGEAHSHLTPYSLFPTPHPLHTKRRPRFLAAGAEALVGSLQSGSARLLCHVTGCPLRGQCDRPLVSASFLKTFGTPSKTISTRASTLLNSPANLHPIFSPGRTFRRRRHSHDVYRRGTALARLSVRSPQDWGLGGRRRHHTATRTRRGRVDWVPCRPLWAGMPVSTLGCSLFHCS